MNLTLIIVLMGEHQCIYLDVALLINKFSLFILFVKRY